MPVYRDKDGNIVEEPTRRDDDKVRFVKKKKVGSGKRAPDDRFSATTKKASKKGRASDREPESAPSATGEPRAGSRAKSSDQAPDPTRLVRRSSRSKTQGSEDKHPETGAPAESDGGIEQLVVGWLVIVKGPGCGSAMEVGYGTNNIGRDASNRIQVDFGDTSISRINHAVLTYDGRGRSFYIQHGGGMNVTYLSDKPVLAPTKLKSMDRISLGHTEFAFVPFCGPDFNWDDEED